MTEAVVLLSGGLDSAVALYWARASHRFSGISAVFFDYGQMSVPHEMEAACRIYAKFRHEPINPDIINLAGLFQGGSSIIGGSEINRYDSVEQATAGTLGDRSYLPLRNALFITAAAHRLLARNPAGGTIILGTRDRGGGFPDCSESFMRSMGTALRDGSNADVEVMAPLAKYAPSREATVALAAELPGCLQALRYSVSCFYGTRCGECLPCHRRKMAFEAVGLKDPAE